MREHVDVARRVDVGDRLDESIRRPAGLREDRGFGQHPIGHAGLEAGLRVLPVREHRRHDGGFGDVEGRALCCDDRG